MLTIRTEQLTRLEAIMLDRFELRLLDHVSEYFPTHWRVIGPEQMRNVVQSAVTRARDGGFATQRDAFMFLSLMLYFGSHFADDPQYPWISAVLTDEMVGQRSERLEKAFDAAIAWIKIAAGDDGKHLKAAYARAHGALLQELERSDQINSEYVLGILRWLWPEKYGAVGEQALRNLVTATVPIAGAHGIATAKGAVLFVIAAFLLGHRAHEDEQCPWLAQALTQHALPAADALGQALAAHFRAQTM